jgi:hypothetical protein
MSGSWWAVARLAASNEIHRMDDQHQQELEVLRRLSPARKLEVMTGLIRQAYRLKTAWLRMTEPELSEEEIAEKVREAVAGGGA